MGADEIRPASLLVRNSTADEADEFGVGRDHEKSLIASSPAEIGVGRSFRSVGESFLSRCS